MTGKRTALLAGAFVLGAAALRPGPVVRRYSLATDRLRPGGRLRFALASDLHFLTGHRREKLLRFLAREKPDYILLPGDVFDEVNHPREARAFLRGAARIAPAFYCPGNHEYYTGRADAVCEAVERLGVTVLRDRFVRLESRAGSLVLAGAEDPKRTQWRDPAYRPMKAARAAFASIPREEGFRILLAHHPDLVKHYRPFGFDLAVSGHAHGGQVRIPFLLNGLYAPGQGLFPAFAGGLYALPPRQSPFAGTGAAVARKAGRASGSSVTLVVSRGVGEALFLPRVFNPTELVFLDVFGDLSDTGNQYQYCTECKE